ncbi:MAG: DNA ligase D [Candidatus Abawacabacteria bacterium RBG_16_42_10]|uniref:DNA ligase (ATP) n=1 Tax=Candidatus Abawacabacteria bacterium RBG_16_42_10 TaxID=1817814 RepID=A0A1F4XLV8_9BACT|nr:MAG: DNA ligase D [Candidatus Abawacabacteria bacterium RBG_16_42_10]
MSLKIYQKKRTFLRTPEPQGKKIPGKGTLKFVVHEHHASHLHYDLRLEVDGVLKSWAVPKGPSTNPEEKRLAVHVEDHPLAYATFKGTIPKGNYGAGKVKIWDHGTYEAINTNDRKESEKSLLVGLKKGHITFILYGKKLHGEFALIQMKKSKNWLLIKKSDIFSAKPSTKPKVKIFSNFSAPIEPMLAHLADKPFDQADWIFEIKWDGYRAIGKIRNTKVELLSRHGLSLNQQFPPIAKELAKISEEMILDGEIVVLDENGRADFQRIQNYKKTGKGNLVYYVFDILEYKKQDLRNLPLLERKKILKHVLPILARVKYSDHIIEHGKELFATAVEAGIEGIMAKDGASTYQIGERSKSWLKIKNLQQQEAVICGITAPRGSRKEFGALVLGVYEKGKLIYIGHTGGGFNESLLKEIKSLLKPLITKKCPFKREPVTNAPVQWLKPKVVCEIRFTEWTQEGMMRHPVFLGIREDKNPMEVTKEKNIFPVNKNYKTNSQFTHLNKIFWPQEKYTKQDLIIYYDKIAPFILPYLKDRPQALHRFPDGITGENFFQKNINIIPEGLETVKIFSTSKNKEINFALCQNKYDLLYLANLGCIEFHPWNSRQQHLDKPDYLLFDLDPLNISFTKVIETALTVKKVLDSAGIKSFCKTSGATGLHVYVPMEAKYSTKQVIEFAKILVTIVHAKLPETTSIERMPAKRNRKVYLDYLQNRRGQNMVAPYSARPRPGAPVSTPLHWQEVKIGLDPKKFTIKTIFKRLKRIGDIWKKVLGKGIDMEKALKKLEKEWKKIKQ